MGHRIKDYFWLSTRMDFVGQISVAGKLAEISPAGKWWAAVPKNQWNVEDESLVETIKENWEEPYGDRRQELVFFGYNLDKDNLTNQLNACLLTADEYKQGPRVWKHYQDPIHPWELIEETEDELV